MADFNQYGTTYRETLEESIGGFGTVEGALKSKLLLLRRLTGCLSDLKNCRILDFGCGTGTLTDRLRHFSVQTFGTDVSVESLRNPVADGMALSLFDGCSLPFADEVFTLVVISCVLHHVPVEARTAVLSEIRRVLVRDGMLVVIEHNPFNPVTRYVVSRCEFDQDAELLSLAAARALLTTTGFVRWSDGYFYTVPPLNKVLSAIDLTLRKLPTGAQYYCAWRNSGYPRHKSG